MALSSLRTPPRDGRLRDPDSAAFAARCLRLSAVGSAEPSSGSSAGAGAGPPLVAGPPVAGPPPLAAVDRIAAPEKPDSWAVTLRGVLSAEECEAVIEATEERGFGAALLNAGGGREIYSPDIRSNSRCIVDSPEFADALFERVRHALPPERDGKRLIGVNERLRVLRYDPGEFFRVHMDGCFERESGPLKGQRTYITLLLYLNEGYEGCETTFYSRLAYVSDKSAPPAALPIPPAVGMVLLHDHNIAHAANPLVAGRKYVLRSDILYG